MGFNSAFKGLIMVYSKNTGAERLNLNAVQKGFGFGGLGVAYWPLVPEFAGSNPAEAVGFLG